MATDSSSAKIGVARTKVTESLMSDYGKASNEFSAQFLARVDQEIPNATLAVFSTLMQANFA